MHRATFQLTLGIIKPDASQMPHALQILKTIMNQEGLRIVKHKFVQMSRHEAEMFYMEHKDRFFYNRLVTFMSSGPLHAIILSHKDAVQRWRQIMGPTKVFRAHIEDPKSIRGMIGLTDTRNSTHGSDSTETAVKEIEFFFPDFNAKEWSRNGCKVTTFENAIENAYQTSIPLE